MEYLKLGDTIDYKTYNALVYLLRKFKRLTSKLQIASVIESDHGTYTLNGGLTAIGDHYILEDDVNISSNDVLKNCFYTFLFTAVDVNLSGTVNRRVIEITGDTGNDGLLNITLPSDSLESNEQLLPDFMVDIVFDPHEYYTPLNSLNVSLVSDKEYLHKDEVATITATVLDEHNVPVTDLTVLFEVNGTLIYAITNSNGEASITYTGTGDTGKITVNVHGSSIVLYDYESIILTVNKSQVTLGDSGYSPIQWLWCNYPVLIDWGDGNNSKVNNPRGKLNHEYTDGVSTHTIRILGEVSKISYFGASSLGGNNSITSIILKDSVTTIGKYGAFCWFSLTSVVLPETLVNIGNQAFQSCTSLTSISIPASVSSIGTDAFNGCSALVDYQLYWDSSDSIITYSSSKMPNNTNTIFTIPYGTTSLYEAKGYPSAKLVERPAPVDTLTVTSDKDILSAYDSESATLTVLGTYEGNPVSGVELEYNIKDKDDNILDNGTVITDGNGLASVTYNATGVGDVTVTYSYRNLLQETYELTDYIRLNSLTSNDGLWSSSTASVSYSQSGMYISNGNWSPFSLLDELSQDVSIEFDIVAMTIAAGTGLYTCLAYDTDQTHNYGQTILNSDGHYKLIIENDVLTVYKDNTQLETHNWAYSSFYWFLWTGGTRKVTLKDLKVKAL